MKDLRFTVNLQWKGTGREGQGAVGLADDAIMTYSSPASMGGKGVGTSPEELLIAAVSSCYSGTLFGILKRTRLPVDDVKIRAVGCVTNHPLQSEFSQLCVHPTICGGDPAKEEEYQRLAETAREKCFIGKTISGNVIYQVGEVIVLPRRRIKDSRFGSQR